MGKHTDFSLFASYNQWMNRKLYAAAAGLSEEELKRDRGAFFKSIFGTLTHIAVADIVWFKRIAAGVPGFASLDCLGRLPMPSFPDRLCDSFAELAEVRATLDGAIVAFCAELTPARLDGVLEYASTKGVPARKCLGAVLLHVFNHQTHHRGQASTLFSQMGVDIGDTDLLLLLPELPPDAA